MVTTYEEVLTGKALEDFNKWYNSNPELYTHPFKLLHLSMKWGVYVEFFDSKNIIMQSGSWETAGSNEQFLYWFDLKNRKDYHLTKLSVKEHAYFLTRAEARIAAIKKANELYNQ